MVCHCFLSLIWPTVSELPGSFSSKCKSGPILLSFCNGQWSAKNCHLLRPVNMGEEMDTQQSIKLFNKMSRLHRLCIYLCTINDPVQSKIYILSYLKGKELLQGYAFYVCHCACPVEQHMPETLMVPIVMSLRNYTTWLGFVCGLGMACVCMMIL